MHNQNFLKWHIVYSLIYIRILCAKYNCHILATEENNNEKLN